MKKSERNVSLIEYFEYLRENDPIIKKSYENVKYKNKTFKSQFTEKFVQYISGLQLNHLDIAKILGCAPSTARGYIREVTRYKEDELLWEKEIYDVKSHEYINLPTKDLNKYENLFLVISDIQAGNLITAYGLDYDPHTTITNYFERLKQELIRVFTERRLAVKQLNIMLLGDLVDGWDIYGNSQHTEGIRGQKQTVNQNMLKLISFITNNFPIGRIHVYGVYGNHGKIRGYISSDNFDMTTMDELHLNIEHYRNYNPSFKNVYSYISDEEVQLVEIGGYKYLFMHGDQIGNKPSLSKLQNESDKRANSKGDHDVMLLGHMHRFTYISYGKRRILVNGCTYESPFVRNRIGAKEDTAMILFASTKNDPVHWLERLDVTLHDFYTYEEHSHREVQKDL